jgi:hypothetical protein
MKYYPFLEHRMHQEGTVKHFLSFVWIEKRFLLLAQFVAESVRSASTAMLMDKGGRDV